MSPYWVMTPRSEAEERLAADRADRLELAQALDAMGRHYEAALMRNLAVPVRVVEGRVVEG